MKTTRYILLGLLMSVALSVSARMYTSGEAIFVNVNQGDAIGDWSKDGANIYIYMFQSTNSSNYLWITMSPLYTGSKVYKGTLPSNIEPWYDRLIVTRGTAAGWGSEKWNQTDNITIPDGERWNCVYNFADASNRWKLYTPAAAGIPAYAGQATAEVISVCPNAKNDPLALRPKLNEDTTGYLYTDVVAYAWYTSLNGTNWTAVKSYAGTYRNDSEENIEDKDFFTTLPDPIPASGIYYYLFSNLPKGRRLVHVIPNAPKCALDCEITSFETAISAVNADDNTYTLDGMVAFGEPNGNLVISCDGKDTTITSPKSPQAFSLHGVPAAVVNGRTTKAYAYFTGNGACRDSIVVDVPNATEAVAVVTRDSLTGKTITLTPVDYDPANIYVWLANGDTIPGAPQVLVVDPFSIDTSVTYTYKEYYPASGDMDDMMDNGGYEADNSDSKYGTYGSTSLISDYDFWGYFDQTSNTQINFYDNTAADINPSGKNSNGFAIVQNAYNFYPTFSTITAREGNHFALFDAATGSAGGNKKAWYATTAKNSKLKLQQGTTYVLSFWAANINNYGEMDNAARFRFYIEDISGPTPVKLDSSEVLDLSLPEYRNNLWHQCSKTYTAKADYNNIRISVVNLNTRTLHIGNDFALDDIQFHPISSVSKVVKSQQQFVVTAHEPKIDAFTATVKPVQCDETDYTIAMHVEYQNPYGQLYIHDITRDTTYKYTVPAVAFDTKVNFDQDIIIKTKEPTHNWEVYFSEWTTARLTTSTAIPGFPAIDTAKIAFSEPGCTDLTTTLTFDLDYTYQQGTLTYWVDALPKQTATYSVADQSKQTLTGLSVTDIPADGKTHTLHVSFDGANSCIKSYNLPAVPFSPVINSVTVSGVPATVSCDDNDYTITVTIVTPYDATGRNIVLSGAKDTTIVATGTSTVVTIKKTDIGGAAQTVTAAYEGTPACSLTSASFTPPVHSMPVITVSPTGLVCDDATQIELPFTIVSGAPDTYDLALGTTHYAGSVSGSDLVFTLTSAPTAGDYTAVVTASTTGSDCSTPVNVNITIALGNSMLSKWTDVLFVNNAAGRFVSYQWYKNGAEMSGETMQRLYDPNGLSGTTDEYMCRMTTTDGQTIYTCPQTFDAVTPSRTLSTGSEVQVIGIYDSMGRPVSGQPGKGIYIVIEELDGERNAKKIIVNE